jgi:thioredoxin reductase (NADPH)
VLLATGGSDHEPSMPHVAEALREGALRYCPVCDGYEVIDQVVGVIAEDASGVGEALYLRRFTPHLTLFLAEGPAALSDVDRRRLEDAGIAWVREPTDSIRLWDRQVTVRHGEAETRCDSVYCALGMRIHSHLATALGAEADEHGYLRTDEHHCTSLPGLYAAGDVSRGLNQITVAYGGAAIAASAMHVALNAMDR